MSKILKIVTNGTVRRVPSDEPVFLLRAQDTFAPSAVRLWADLVAAGGGDPAIVADARAHADKMQAWPVKKLPDLPCPEDVFVTVPATTLPNGTVVPEFQVSRYLCTVVDGKATVSEYTVPTVDIDYHDASSACEAAGCKLIRETQALALAWNIYNVDANWSGGKVGEGSLAQGLHANTVDGPQCNDFEPDPANPEECRIFMLSNGDIIYDAAGHLYTWVFDDVQGDEKGLISKPFTAESPSISTCPQPSMKKGVGWIPSLPCNWSSDALVRGGCWYSEDDAGVFYLSRGHPVCGDGGIGFRCTK